MTTARHFPVELLECEPEPVDVVDPKLWRGMAFATPPSIALWALIFWALGLL